MRQKAIQRAAGKSKRGTGILQLLAQRFIARGSESQHTVAVSRDHLAEAFDHNVRAQLERPTDEVRGKGVVDHQQTACRVRGFCTGSKVWNAQTRIADRFHNDQIDLGLLQSIQIIGGGGIEGTSRNAPSLKIGSEHLARLAVKFVGDQAVAPGLRTLIATAAMELMPCAVRIAFAAP